MKQFLRKRTIVAVVLLFAGWDAGFAQSDTLHLYYHHTATKPHDTTLAKMDKWIKSLNGQKQDLRIVAYYHKYEFRKFAQERVDEMFLVVNRKARSLFNIQEMEAKRGKDYQRTTVDLIYQPAGGGDKKASAKPADKAVKKAETPSAEKVKEEKSGKTDKEKKSTAKEEPKTGKAEKQSEKEKTSEKEDKKSSEKKTAAKSDKEAKKTSKQKSDDDDKKESKSSKSREKPAKKEKTSGGKTETWEAKPIE